MRTTNLVQFIIVIKRQGDEEGGEWGEEKGGKEEAEEDKEDDDEETIPAMEAGRLTVNLHLSCFFKSNDPVSLLSLQQNTFFDLPSPCPSLHESCRYFPINLLTLTH